MFADGGFSTINLNSNDTITVAAPLDSQIPWRLPPDSTLTMKADSIFVQRGIHSDSGTVDLSAVATRSNVAGQDGREKSTITVSEEIDVSGRWINDNALLHDELPTDAAYIHGGKVRLTAVVPEVNIIVQKNALFDVSGGGWLQGDGTLINGAGGDISINAASQNSELVLDGELHGFGLCKGGSLAVTYPKGLSFSETFTGDDQFTNITQAYFSKGGFNSISLIAKQFGIVFKNDAVIHPVVQNRMLNNGYTAMPTGSNIADFSTLVQLPEHVRKPVDLDFHYEPISPSLDFEANGIMHMQAGASIVTDVKGRVAMESDSRMLIEGEIAAPAGNIELSLNNFSFQIYHAGKTLWLSPTARLSTAGIVQLRPNDLGVATGEVLPGGEVKLDVSRGFIIAENGSQIDISGVAGDLDLPINATGELKRRKVAGSAGTLSLSTAEGAVMDGEIIAHAGAENTAAGRLNIDISFTGRDADNENGVFLPGFSENARAIVLHNHGDMFVDDGEPGYRPGDEIDMVDGQILGNFTGKVFLDETMLVRSGLDFLNLRSESTYINRGATGGSSGGLDVQIPGEIQFQTSLDDNQIELKLDRALLLDAAGLVNSSEQAESTITLQAPYIRMGNTRSVVGQNFDRSQSTPELKAGAGSLTLNASGTHADGGMLELLNRSVAQGFAEVNLQSQGDLRVRGSQNNRPGSADVGFVGGFATRGDLNILAGQIYPSTLTRFDVTADSIRIERQSSAQAVMSAGGQIRFTADAIYQHGVVKAPLGELRFDVSAGESGLLDFGADSVTSTSLENQLVPFGELEAGLHWKYPLDPYVGQGLVFTQADFDELPAQKLKLKGKNIVIQPQAQIDLSGGGDLMAIEFVPGVTGTRDFFANNTVPGMYALLPAGNPNFVPYDPLIMKGTTISGVDDSPLQPYDQIYLAAGSGVPAGTYTLLPPRYGLMPGAYMVREIKGYTDILDGQAFQRLDGSTVVAGYRRFAGTMQRDSRSSGFAVISAASDYVQKQARYDLAFANSYLPGNIERFDMPLRRLPQDAGSLSIEVNDRLELNGDISGQAWQGRGANMDIAADRLAVSADGVSGEGVVGLSTESLSSLNVESLFLGGIRDTSQDGVRLAVQTQELVVEEGSHLTAPEIILAARQQLRVGANAVIEGVSAIGETAADTLTVENVPLLRVSSNSQVELNINLSDSGAVVQEGLSLDVNPASVLKAGASVTVNAAGNTRFAPRMESAGDTLSLSLTGNTISIGEVTGVEGGLAVDGGDLAAMFLQELVLQSLSSIDLYGGVTVTADERIEIDSGAIDGKNQAPGQAVRFEATQIGLGNSHDQAPAALGGQGELVLDADYLLLRDGGMALRGFTDVTVNARQAVVGMGGGQGHKRSVSSYTQNDETLQQSRTDLHIQAGVITAAAGADTELTVNGELTINANDTEEADLSQTGLGARLDIDALSINHSGHIVLPSGVVTIAAAGTQTSDGVTLSGAGSIDVQGRARQFDDTEQFSPGGHVELSAEHGGVNIDGGTQINVSAAMNNTTGGNAGSLSITAPQGQVRIDGKLSAAALTPDQSGEFLLDADRIEDFKGLLHTLNPQQQDGVYQGFHAAQQLHIRRGNFSIDTGDTVRARRFELYADGLDGAQDGNIDIFGSIDASGTQGGSVRLYAKSALVLHSGGQILADARDENKRGGRVELGTTLGYLALQENSVIDVSGKVDESTESFRLDDNGNKIYSINPISVDTGEIVLRAPRASVAQATDAAGTPLVDENGEPVQALDADGRGLFFTTDASGNRAFSLLNAEQIPVDGNGNTVVDTGRNDIAVTELAAEFKGPASVVLEANQSYLLAAGTDNKTHVTSVEIADLETKTRDFMDSAAGVVRQRLGIDDASIHIRPGVEIQSPSDLVLDSDWYFLNPTDSDNGWRYWNGLGDSSDVANVTESGTLSIRAQGNLTIQGHISDGIRKIPLFQQDVPEDMASWSYRLVAGADLTAADPAGVRYVPNTVQAGVFQLNDKLIRTGDGDIEIASADDFSLNNSAVYTAGRMPEYKRFLWSSPKHGGDISIASGGSIRGVDSNQFVFDWRQNTRLPQTQDQVSFGVRPDKFKHNIAAFGGGNVSVIAGENIENVSISIPLVRHLVPTTTAGEVLPTYISGGGNITVEAGKDIRGGVFYLGDGELALTAFGSIGETLDGSKRSPLIAMNGGRVKLSARKNLTLESVLDPDSQLIPSARSYFGSAVPTFLYHSYDPNSHSSLESIAGDIQLHNAIERLANLSLFETFNIYPPTVAMLAFEGDVFVNNTMRIFASATGNIEIFARDVVLDKLIMSGANVDNLPSIDAAIKVVNAATFNTEFESNPNVASQFQAYHAGEAEHLGDKTYAKVYASNDILLTSNGKLVIAKKSRVVAGRDIRDLLFWGQHLAAEEVSVIKAGRDIIYRQQRQADGKLAPANFQKIWLNGPGNLFIAAGRDLDLRTSTGIEIGKNDDTWPARYPGIESNASVTVLAGVNEDSLNSSLFIDRYYLPNELQKAFISALAEQLSRPGLTVADAAAQLQNPQTAAQVAAALDSVAADLPAIERAVFLQDDNKDDFIDRMLALYRYQTALLDYVTAGSTAKGGGPTQNFSSALEALRGYATSEQFPVMLQAFYGEIKQSGEFAVRSGSSDYRRGFAAITTLLPGSTSDSTTYAGDVSLYFSKIYTYGGGDINLLAPGGIINAGLAQTPSALGIEKSAGDLGIVAQGGGDINSFSFADFQVEESRVFTAGRGSILQWVSLGDIDAGRGAKTAVSAANIVRIRSKDGRVTISGDPSITGSGIRQLCPGLEAICTGSVSLFTPNGVVNASDAGIGSSGDITIGAQEVLGADNIDFGGAAAGVPVGNGGGLQVNLSGTSGLANVGKQALDSATDTSDKASNTPMSDDALSFLEVEIIGFGE